MNMRFTVLLFLFANVGYGQSKVLHYDETEGYDHGTRTNSFNFFKSLEGMADIAVTQDSDGSEFTMAKLADYDLVIFSNTSGINILSSEQQDALEWFLDVKGGGLIGIHAATDTYRHSSANGGKKGEWDWFAETLGGSVQTGPNHTSQNHVNTIRLIEASEVTSNLTLPWTKQEEYYYWENGYLNTDITEVLRVDNTGGNSYDNARPVAWQRTNSAGSRIFYTSLGHKNENFSGPGFSQFRLLLQDAVEWAVLASAIVPAEIISFVGHADDKQANVHLNWSTASEVNTDVFEIERSVNAINWQTIAVVKAAMFSTEIKEYNFVDRSPFANDNIYRLKQIDMNDAFQYSDLINVKMDNKKDLSVTPNPSVRMTSVNFGEYVKAGEIQVLDISGNLVVVIQVERKSEISIDVSDYPVGMYYLNVEWDNFRKVVKLVKI